MDEGHCFRCGWVPRLCKCPEGPLENPPPSKPPAPREDNLRPYQRSALEDLREVYRSPRGFRLAYSGKPGEHPVLTCELYPKWYALYLVDPGGTVRQAPLDLDELEQYAEGATTVGDHCWNPYVLQRLADAKDWLVDDLSFDLLVGRWHTMGMKDPEKQSDEAIAEKVHFALRLAKLQANCESNVDEDVTTFLVANGIEDIYNVPKKWTEVRWRGKTYVLCELEDEEGIVTPFGLYLDWPALVSLL